jgi:hypothetical protein
VELVQVQVVDQDLDQAVVSNHEVAVQMAVSLSMY